jgi:hypothetical protein
VDNVRTPTLVIHSEDDLRCPIEQGQRYFTALKRNGVETALLVFPGEDHELSRSGTPHHRRQRFEHILRWWSRFLPTPGNPAEPPASYLAGTPGNSRRKSRAARALPIPGSAQRAAYSPLLLSDLSSALSTYKVPCR